ncbi:MAG TPA: hypothetical protein VNL96_02030 [Gemmatimonadaceae bacterium]|nr:hypothetical protein [Gemmatimonadaceae bacterium]
MRRLLSGFVVAALTAVVASQAEAQGRVSGLFAVGAAAAADDLSEIDSTKTGWQIMVGGERAVIGDAFAIRLDGTFGFSKRESLFRESALLFGANLRLVWHLPIEFGPLSPYVMGGGGLLSYRYQPGQSGRDADAAFKNRFMAGGGAGLDFKIGSSTLFVEGRYETGDNRTLIPVQLGVRFGK